MTQMRIEKLVLKGLNQFRNLHLDFTDPKTGEPLEKVCFIGPNGTGKTTLLNLLCHISTRSTDQIPASVAAIVKEGNKQFPVTNPRHTQHGLPLLRGLVSAELLSNFGLGRKPSLVWSHPLSPRADRSVLTTADTGSRLPEAVPTSTLREAFDELEHGEQIRWLVKPETVNNFWNELLRHCADREVLWKRYLAEPATRRMTVADAEAAFDLAHLDVLAELARLWAKILDKAGLEFDYKAAKRPTQLTDNLEAFVKVKSTGEVITDYNVLSSGMRNFLFRLGHVFALYFGRKIERGFLFVDEPEDSLYPDFLYDLIDIYLDIIKGQNTQFFVATHSPIIAAQFRPEERFILNFDESYHVVARRGVSPEGDDPNHLLYKDFAVANLYGKKGIENWNRFVELRRQIEHETDKTKKLALADEYMTIGNAYNFNPKNI